MIRGEASDRQVRVRGKRPHALYQVFEGFAIPRSVVDEMTHKALAGVFISPPREVAGRLEAVRDRTGERRRLRRGIEQIEDVLR
jgi:hypothetical protein